MWGWHMVTMITVLLPNSFYWTLTKCQLPGISLSWCLWGRVLGKNLGELAAFQGSKEKEWQQWRSSGQRPRIRTRRCYVLEVKPDWFLNVGGDDRSSVVYTKSSWSIGFDKAKSSTLLQSEHPSMILFNSLFYEVTWKVFSLVQFDLERFKFFLQQTSFYN